MARHVLVHVRPWEFEIAVLDNDVLTDFVVEKKINPTLVGSIFKGRVKRVLPGMEAAFVDIGLPKAGFLFFGDVYIPDDEEQETSEEASLSHWSSGDKKPQGVSPVTQIKEGQSILVQVTKDPVGQKGPRLTTYLALPGRYLVYLSSLNQVAVSRRIDDLFERQRLMDLGRKWQKDLIQSGDNQPGGIIFRTQSEGVSEDQLFKEFQWLRSKVQEIHQQFHQTSKVGPLFQDVPSDMRVLRDLITDQTKTVWVDDEATYQRYSVRWKEIAGQMPVEIKYFEGPGLIFDVFHVKEEIQKALKRRIWLKSGGYVVFDETEALTVVDVNTGRYTGSSSLEETIFKTNLEAAAEIANQIRLRNLGGIIVVDFIDMGETVHRQKVLETLKKHLRHDPMRTQVLGMTSLGLVEMTRKRTRNSLNYQLLEVCPFCQGTGKRKKIETVAGWIWDEIQRHLKHPLARQFGRRLRVYCHPWVQSWFRDYLESHAHEDMIQILRQVTFSPQEGWELDSFEVIIEQ